MTDNQELSPDDAWLSQYRQLAEGTMINDYSTLSEDGSVVMPSPEEQQRIMKANLEELLSVSKRLNINVTSPPIQSQSALSVDDYLPTPNNMDLLEDGVSAQQSQY